MKIISMADIHGDFETFDKALKTEAVKNSDVICITGDLAGSVFEGKEKSYFINIINNLGGLAQQIYYGTNGQTKTFHDSMEFLISGKVEAPNELKKLGKDYLNFERTGRERMSNQYQEFKQRFDELEQKVILIPGNWDGKCIDDVLANENIHNKSYEEVNGIKFIGYGGAEEHPRELPLDLTIQFNDDEAYSHLCEQEDAEVVLTHDVPRGFEGNGRHSGRYSLLSYLFRNAPSLILVGHTHEPLVIEEKKTGTIIANPGNLGRYRDEDFGTFLGLDIGDIEEPNSVRPEAMYKIKGNRVGTY